MIVALDGHFFILLGADKTKRPRAHRMIGDFGSAADRNNADSAIGKIPQQSREWLLQMENYRVVIRRIDAIHELVGGSLCAANLALQKRIECPLHIARGEWMAIMELDPVMQMKNISLGIRYFPSLRESRRDAQVLVAGKQIVKEKAVDALGIRIQSHPRIEVRRATLDDHHQGVGIRFAAARKKRKKREKTRQD